MAKRTTRSTARKPTTRRSPSPASPPPAPSPSVETVLIPRGRHAPLNHGDVEIESEETDGEKSPTAIRPGTKKRKRGIYRTTTSPPADNRLIKRLKSSHRPRGWHTGLPPAPSSPVAARDLSASPTPGVVANPLLRVSEVVGRSGGSVLEWLSESRDRVMIEKVEKFERKGKGREPPLGMLLESDDLELLWYVNWAIQGRLINFGV